MTEEQTDKKPEIEVYEVSAEELLTLQLLETRAAKAQSDLQLAAQTLETFRHNLSGKYSEHGKYRLVGEVDLKTRQGKRILSG